MVDKKIAENLHDREVDPRGVENRADCPSMEKKERRT